MEICDAHNLNGIETGVGQKHYLPFGSAKKVFGIVLWRITEGLMSTSWFKLQFGLTDPVDEPTPARMVNALSAR